MKNLRNIKRLSQFSKHFENRYNDLMTKEMRRFIEISKSEKWKFLRKSGGVSLYRIVPTDSKFYSFKTECIIDNSIDNIYDNFFSHDPNKVIDRYDGVMKSFQILHDFDQNCEVIHESLTFGGGPKSKLSDREFLYCYKSLIEESRIVGFGKSLSSNDSKLIPLLEENNIRGEMFGGMILEKLTDKVNVTQIVWTDPKGTFPFWFYNCKFNFVLKIVMSGYTHMKTNKKMKRSLEKKKKRGFFNGNFC